MNRWLSAATVILLVAAAAWVLTTLGRKGQLDAAKWVIFLKPTTWSTYILPGLFWTIAGAVVSIALALVLGAVLGVGRLSPVRWVRWVCAIVIEFFRSIPVLVLMLFAYSAFAMMHLVPSSWLGFTAVVFGLTMYNGSVIADVIRSGIQALPKGQGEAALALGLTERQTLWTILFPQTVAAMLPAIISQMVIALKDSALGYMIGFVEVVRSGRQLGEYYGAMLPALIVVAIIMILINWALSAIAERIEWQLRAGRARRNIVAKVPHQKDQGIETKDQAVVDWHAEGHQDMRATFD